MTATLFVLLEIVVVAAIIFLLHALRTQYGRALLYVFLGAIQYVQMVWAETVFTRLFDTYTVSPGSVVLFAGSLCAILLVYIRDDVPQTRQLIYAVVLANLGLVLLTVVARGQSNFDPATAGALAGPLDLNVRPFLYGTLLLLCDTLLVIVLYGALGRIRWLPLVVRLMAALVGVLAIDGLVWVTFSFGGSPRYGEILAGNVLGKALAGASYGLLLWGYLAATRRSSAEDRAPPRDIFDLFTYRERYQKAEARRLESELRYRSVVEAAHDAILVLGPGGELVDANPAFETTWGRSRSSCTGRAFADLVAAADREAADAFVRAGLAGGHAVEMTLRIEHAPGDSRQVEFGATALRENGTVSGTIVVGRDVSDRVRLEARLRQGARMEAVGQLAGGIAHDFNNILTVIITSCEMLTATIPAGGEARGDLEVIRAAADRAALLTRQLLAYSRRQMLERRVVDVSMLVSSTVSMLRRLIREDITLELSLDTAPITVLIDAPLLEQALVNLVVNSRDAMPAGGLLRIATGRELIADPVEVDSGRLEVGLWMTLRVSDTGAGMGDDERSRAFEPFFTTKEPGSGTGLGLASVYGFVRQSGGHIRLESTPGAGTAVTIYLPPADGVASTPVAPRVEAARGSETILVVEDRADVREATGRALHSLGYRVLLADGAHEAEAVLAAHEGTVDLLLTDVVMPGLSGPELANRLRARTPGLRVLLMSGYPSDVLSLADAGSALPLLPKPFSHAVLAQWVRNVLDAAGTDSPRA